MLQAYFFDQIPPEFFSQEKLQLITNIQDISTLPLRFICLPSQRKSQLTEVAVYLMGQLHENIVLPYETITSILKSIPQHTSLIVKLRSLWLLERVSNTHTIKRDLMVKDLFEPLVDFFCQQTEFVL